MIRRLLSVIVVCASAAHGIRARADSCSPMSVCSSGPQSYDQVACCNSSTSDDGCGPCENQCCGDECAMNMSGGNGSPRSQGKPVDPMTGFMFFTDTDLDVSLPVGPPILFDRSYSTAWAESHGGLDEIGVLGPGWAHRYMARLDLTGASPASKLTYRKWDTGSEVFTLTGTNTYSGSDPGRIVTFDAATGQYTVSLPDGSAEIFDSAGALRVEQAADQGEAQLVYVNDDSPCAATGARPAGQLCRVDFINGQQLWFSYSGTPTTLATVSWDAAATDLVVTLAYTGGYLTTATRADSSATTYAYNYTHTFYAAPGNTVNLITSVVDPDGILRESFSYQQPANTASQVVAQTTPDDSWSYSYGVWTDANPRATTVSSIGSNMTLTWSLGRLQNVCYENDDQNYYSNHCSQQVLADGGAPLATCVVDTQGRATVFERDAYGRKTGITPGATSCTGLTASEEQYQTLQAWAGTTNNLGYQSWVSVDPSAPPGFRSAHVWDYSSPSGATNPNCDSGSCLDPASYNQGTLLPVVQQDVQIGRTFGDVDGGWVTQVQVVQFTYGPNNELVQSKGPRTDIDDSITRTYFAGDGGFGAGRLESISRGTQVLMQYANYTELGMAQTVTDQSGAVTRITYDAVGRMKTSQTADGSITTYTYFPSGRLQTVLLPEGNTIVYTYAPTGPVVSIQRIDTSGNVDEEIDYTYGNSNSSEVTQETYSVSGGGGRQIGYGYDYQGRRNLTVFNRPGTLNYRSSHFDENGELDWVTDESHQGPSTAVAYETNNQQYLYDTLGRMLQFQKQIKGQWQAQSAFGYNVHSNITQVYDATGILTTYVYDDFGRLVESISPDSGRHVYLYDTAGNLIREVRPDGTVLTRTFDDRDRLLTLMGGGVNEAYSYDGSAPSLTDCATGSGLSPTYGAGRLTSVTDAAGTWVWGYTSLGQEAFEALESAGSTCARTFRWTYTANEDPLTMTYPSGHVITYVYPESDGGSPGQDSDVPLGITFSGGGRTIALASQAGLVQGTVEAWTAGNGFTWTLPRANDGSPTQLTISKTVTLTGDTAILRQRGFGTEWPDGGNFEAQVSPTGDPTAMVESNPSRSQVFGYDTDRGYLNGAEGPYGEQAFGYENSGDRTSANDAGYCYQQGSHRLLSAGNTQFTYGPGGDAWTITADGGETTLCYDEQERVSTEVGPGGEYIVDRRDFRHQLAVEVEPLNGLETDYRFGPSGQLWLESGYGSLESEYPRLTTEYVYLSDQPVAMVQSEDMGDGGFTTPAVIYLFGGHLGEPYLEADENGDVVRSYDFQPFGTRAEGPSTVTFAIGQDAGAASTSGSYFSEVEIPGALTTQLHFTSHNFGGCPLLILGQSGISLGQVDDTMPQDYWTPAYPGDGVELSIPSCGDAFTFNIDVGQGNLGAASVTALNLQTASPYPPAGQQFTLNLAAPTFVQVSNISIASCDTLQAKDHVSGQVLWTAPASFGTQASPVAAGWTPALSGEVEIGIWGNGCNSTQGAGGFALAEEVAETYWPTAKLLLPGQIEADIGAANWNRIFDSKTGRYLSPDPIPREQYIGDLDRGLEISWNAPFVYAFAAPLQFKDSTGAFAANGCKNVPTVGECERQAEKITDPCFRSCVIAQCLDFEVKLDCTPATKSNVCTGSNANGAGGPMGARGAPVESQPKTIAWCEAQMSASCMAQLLVHEMAHTCGWKDHEHQGVPDVEDLAVCIGTGATP